jgi:hypothetical protein
VWAYFESRGLVDTEKGGLLFLCLLLKKAAFWTATLIEVALQCLRYLEWRIEIIVIHVSAGRSPNSEKSEAQ